MTAEGWVCNDGTVFWQDGADDEADEAAVLVHVDNGNSLLIEQRDRYIVLSRNKKNVRRFARLLLSKAE